ncbi:hypothetical protein RI103_05600 [Paraburkholderia sp. FT54]|uniref:hypothetical protein n=1 Tax=Paraburkholderia sp. FT54 TaxID=3074437 RepID=UPI002877A344|nr:hypothetical protein [Paraburkholderia sp. FT54]WNC90826.1 hypothetical protein RI103_05600 [Paraburkholderia sp. FT54]
MMDGDCLRQASDELEAVRDEQLSKAINGRLSVGRLLANMDSRHVRAGEVLFRKVIQAANCFTS